MKLLLLLLMICYFCRKPEKISKETVKEVPSFALDLDEEFENILKRHKERKNMDKQYVDDTIFDEKLDGNKNESMSEESFMYVSNIYCSI